MPRPLRVHVPDGIYHVILRGNDRNPIFFCRADRDDWEDLVSVGVKRYEISIHGYCWMTNHIHMAVQVTDRPLWEFMRWLASRYAYITNRRLNRTGHLFERRHRARFILDETYLATLVRYIHRNPITANIVDQAIHYPWSSHRDYVGGSRHSWLTTDFVLARFADHRQTAIKAFRDFVESEKEDESPIEYVEPDNDSLVSTPSEKSNLSDALVELATKHCLKHGLSPQALCSPSRSHRHARIRGAIAHEAIQAGVSLAELSRYFKRHESVILRSARKAEQCKRRK